MRIIKDSKIIEDSWQLVQEAEALPEGDIIVSAAFWREHKSALKKRKGRFAIYLNGNDELEELAQDIKDLPLIALEFPAFKDGRCYSHARLLRERYGYTGELRAIGDVLRDQLFFMQRCGINSFQIRADKDIDNAIQGLKGFSVTYQAAADGVLPISRYR